MKDNRSIPGFTLIEMIIAITVFTIFIGFSISAYLTFHRANQEALSERNLLMSAQAVMTSISDAIRESKIDYSQYDSGGMPMTDLELTFTDATRTDTLYLLSADEETSAVYAWDSEEEVLTFNGVPLHSDAISVTYANFRIFPSEDPFENRTETSLQYQPFVTIDLTFSIPGRVREELSFELHTSVTTRLYQ